MDEDRISRSELNTLFLALHFAVEECVAGRFSRTDLEATRDKVFLEYQAAYRTSDVPTGPCEGIAKQNPSTQNLEDVTFLCPVCGGIGRATFHVQGILLRCSECNHRWDSRVKAVAVDTNEECETASQAHTGTKD